MKRTTTKNPPTNAVIVFALIIWWFYACLSFGVVLPFGADQKTLSFKSIIHCIC